VEEALVQYQDTKKEREREMSLLNKKVHMFLFICFYLSLCPWHFLINVPAPWSFLLTHLPLLDFSISTQAKKLSRQQGINESTLMDVEGRKEALCRVGEEKKEGEEEAKEEGDGQKEG